MKFNRLIVALIGFVLIIPVSSFASGHYQAQDKAAVVIAMFGTTVEPALAGLITIQNKLEKQFPHTEVRIAFTSNIIRKKWQERAKDPAYVKAHPEIPEEILNVKTPLATIADLQNEGYNQIVLQPTHVSMGEEFLDLHTYVNGLMAMGTVKKAHYKPFKKIALGRPAMGTFGTEFPYTQDLETLAKAMAPDAQLAAQKKSALVYMGHGNEHFPGNGGAYMEFAAKMRQMYPDVITLIGTVEGYPGIDDVMESLKLYGVKEVILKPFMVVAGDHAMNDMASDEDDSWKTVLTENEFKVTPIVQGLGENKDFARIFMTHAIEAAQSAGIELK